MENMQYAEELVKEFLVFRGFTNTLQAYESELSTEIGRNFEVDKILDLVFSVYIPKYQLDRLLSLFNFFKQCLTSPTETVFYATLVKLEQSVLRYYVVNALKSGKQDKVVEFFGASSNYLMQKREDWLAWFAIPFIKNPSLDPQFRMYFSKEWSDTLILSFRNFLSGMFSGTRIPALLKISTEKNTIKCLKSDIKQLNNKLSELQALLEVKEAELTLLRRNGNNIDFGKKNLTKASTAGSSLAGQDMPGVYEESSTLSTAVLGLESQSSSSAKSSSRDGKLRESSQLSHSDNDQILVTEEDFPEVKVDFQETFLGHNSAISSCRFSASGSNIASSSTDGTVRIWTYDSSTPSSKNATIYCGAEVSTLSWECRSDRLLLIGTANGGIKAWNADAKRVVCDLSTSKDFPSVLDLKCSPVDPVFVSAAASRRHGSTIFDRTGFASLTVWHMKTWKPLTVLPLGEDPPAITSLCFNHNGKILAASATDGMIHMFDMSAGLQITGWPAHDSPVSSVLFGPAETSIFSLGSDGKIFEWSLHNQGQILWSRDCSRFCNPVSFNTRMHEVALDSDGKRLLVTSGLVRAPIYQVQGHERGLRTLPHSASITSVDWHPTLPIYVTGSADHSVRVTSII
ncbi:WD repeat-containing protein 91 homolog [Brachypodium distachyon]|uniref:WD repeat-containing protein 91 homolog n=1 Tax=Brachypodium distachyon TaxID=15368 RepID=UPI00052FF12D|nr:WD repeat-containing protein 91 homolog [Brachypodium distachyon]XP_024317465.1 WD repeat-containing protein 91 homolog [Brachypodium distachyon]|eukprot:XP_003574046.2 WD repeat-containing protein 91 homolog [Brachypodium distachyon]